MHDRATHPNGISVLQLQKQRRFASYKSTRLLCPKLGRAWRSTRPRSRCGPSLIRFAAAALARLRPKCWPAEAPSKSKGMRPDGRGRYKEPAEVGWRARRRLKRKAPGRQTMPTGSPSTTNSLLFILIAGRPAVPPGPAASKSGWNVMRSGMPRHCKYRDWVLPRAAVDRRRHRWPAKHSFARRPCDD